MKIFLITLFIANLTINTTLLKATSPLTQEAKQNLLYYSIHPSNIYDPLAKEIFQNELYFHKHCSVKAYSR
jgi:hypothetical protein